MKDLARLENEFDDARGNPLEVIRFYEDSKIDIDHLNESSEANKNFKTKVLGDYGISLAVNGNAQKAIIVLDNFIQVFEKDLKNSNGKHLKSSYSEMVMWTYGYTLYNVKRYQDAEKTFLKLLELYPDNSKYKNWLAASKTNRFKTIRQFIWITILLILGIDFLFGQTIVQELNNYFWVIVLGLSISFGLLFELYIYTIKKRYE